MALVETLQDLVVDPLEGRDDEQAARAGQLLPDALVLQDVLHLGGAVEGEIREALVHGPDDAERVAHPVEEVGVAEGDVPGADGDEAGDVGEHDVLPDDADPAVVDGRHGAVAAAVDAAVARLDVADEALLAVDREMGVALERGQEIARRQLEAPAPEMDERLARPGRGLPALSETVHPGHETGLVLAGDHPIGEHAHGEVAAHRRVEAVQADRKLGASPARRRRRPHREAHGRVHRHREGDGLGPLQGLEIPGLDRQVEAAEVVAHSPQQGGGRGHVQRLVAELVGRDQENPHTARVALYPSDGSPITISRRPWAVRNACSTSSGVSPRAKRKPR